MTRVKFLACCRTTLIDRFRNSVSLIELLEELQVEGFPVFLPEVSVVILFERESGEPEEITGMLSLTLSGVMLAERRVQSSFAGVRRCRNIVFIQGLVITAPGPLVAKFENETGTLSSSWTIDVQQHARMTEPTLGV